MNSLRRLHVAAIFVSFLQALRSFLVPLLISLFIGGTQSSGGFFRMEYVWIAIIALSFIAGVVHWIFFRYRFEDGELYIQKGMFVRKKRYIQQQRVQSIDITAGLLQRIFGLVKLKIETAGGGLEPEIQLIAISREEAEEIRSKLLNKTSQEAARENDEREEEGKPELTWKLKPNRLVIAALTSSGIGLTLSAVIALFSQVEQFIPDAYYEQVMGLVSRTQLSAIAVVIVIILLLSWFLSFLGTVLKYGHFTIETYPNEIVISRGLLEKRQLTIHPDRVTAVRIVRNIFRQPFGFATVYVESAGGGTKDEQLSTVLIPIARNNEIEALLADVLPRYAHPVKLEGAPRRALLRFCFPFVIVPLLLALAVGFFWNPYGYYGLLLALLGTGLGYLQYRDAGAGVDGPFIAVRFRKLSQVHIISFKPKIQAAETRVSPLQRRKELSSFRFSVLSSVVGKSFTVPHLDERQVGQLLQWFSAEKRA
ncbi:PH domain-containing protein [Alkalihalobacillus oceani]|uniref:PH domain-containing protein n=1 Tax=Halalkalibacter oceani TaxID=1653776 RepID=UPI00203C5447|nr:PH domain-containing protein [Halalkalibacter oceani]MCM3761288.1 PH domain-containing protein [Halalkalibacter oceani]